jgi:tetratricopeptide (TPR) repeat protein
MKKNIILIPLLMMLSLHTRADKADSLKQVLRSDISDTMRVNTLIELARLYAYSKPDTCFLLAQEGIALARQAGFEKGEAQGMNRLGVALWFTGNYPKSLEYFFQALKIFEKLNNREGLCKVNGNIGIIYSEMGEFQKSIQYYHKERTIAAYSNNAYLLIQPLIGLGDTYEKINQLDSALIYTNQAYELTLQQNDTYLKGITLNNLGNIHAKMHQDEIALAYYHQSLSIVKAIGDIDGLCEITMGMAQIFKRAGERDSALYYSRISLASGYKGSYNKRILNASSFLSDYFKSMNRVDSAYRYQQITIAAKDSLFSQEKMKALQNLTFQEQIRQQEIAEANQKADEERKVNIQMLGIGAFISFFFGVLFMYSKKRTHPRTIRFLGMMGLLLLFEFISLFLHPYIAAWTHHIPMLMLAILVGIASVLVPLHHKLQELVKERLAKKLAPIPEQAFEDNEL